MKFIVWLLFCVALLGITLADGDYKRCYDCNYDPDWQSKLSYKSEGGTGTGNRQRGFPRCALEVAGDENFVENWPCHSGTCFLRKDTNGLVYRGCADSWNLPWGVDTSRQCEHQGQVPSLWWFCEGDTCNGGKFGEGDVCATDVNETVHELEADDEGPDDGYKTHDSDKYKSVYGQDGGEKQEDNRLEDYPPPEAYQPPSEVEDEEEEDDGKYKANYGNDENQWWIGASPFIEFDPPVVADRREASEESNQKKSSYGSKSSGGGSKSGYSAKSSGKSVKSYGGKSSGGAGSGKSMTSSSGKSSGGKSVTSSSGKSSGGKSVTSYGGKSSGGSSGAKSMTSYGGKSSSSKKSAKSMKSSHAQSGYSRSSKSNQESKSNAPSQTRGWSGGYGASQYPRKSKGKHTNRKSAQQGNSGDSKKSSFTHDTSGSKSGGSNYGKNNGGAKKQGRGGGAHQTLSNPCDGHCRGNPSGLFPHPLYREWFVQCAPGRVQGQACTCCHPQILRCPRGTSFDPTAPGCNKLQGDSLGGGETYVPLY